MVVTDYLNLSDSVTRSLSRLRPYTVVFLFLSLSCTNLKMPNPEDGAAHDGGSSSQGHSAIVDEVFSMFKSYLEVKLEEKGKQLESKSKLDKQVTQMKFKGNQKQFEHNAEMDAIFDRMRSTHHRLCLVCGYLSGK